MEIFDLYTTEWSTWKEIGISVCMWTYIYLHVYVHIIYICVHVYTRLSGIRGRKLVSICV